MHILKFHASPIHQCFHLRGCPSQHLDQWPGSQRLQQLAHHCDAISADSCLYGIFTRSVIIMDTGRAVVGEAPCAYFSDCGNLHSPMFPTPSISARKKHRYIPDSQPPIGRLIVVPPTSRRPASAIKPCRLRPTLGLRRAFSMALAYPLYHCINAESSPKRPLHDCIMRWYSTT